MAFWLFCWGKLVRFNVAELADTEDMHMSEDMKATLRKGHFRRVCKADAPPHELDLPRTGAPNPPPNLIPPSPNMLGGMIQQVRRRPV